MVSDQNKEEIKKRWCRLKTRNRWGRRRTKEEDDGDVHCQKKKKRERKEKKGKEKNNEMSGSAFLNYKGRDNKIYEITNLPLY